MKIQVEIALPLPTTQRFVAHMRRRASKETTPDIRSAICTYEYLPSDLFAILRSTSIALSGDTNSATAMHIRERQLGIESAGIAFCSCPRPPT